MTINTVLEENGKVLFTFNEIYKTDLARDILEFYQQEGLQYFEDTSFSGIVPAEIMLTESVDLGDLVQSHNAEKKPAVVVWRSRTKDHDPADSAGAYHFRSSEHAATSFAIFRINRPTEYSTGSTHKSKLSGEFEWLNQPKDITKFKLSIKLLSYMRGKYGNLLQ